MSNLIVTAQILKPMPYYITQISVSLNARNDEEAKQKIEKLLNGARGNKECKPYVNSISKANHENKFLKFDDKIIKSLNINK